MANTGVAPPDITTTVGQLRVTLGDVDATGIAGGVGTYAAFSDAELSQFLTMSGQAILQAAGFAYLQASGIAAQKSKSVADYDLRVDLTKRAADLRATAEMYFEAERNANEFFDVVFTGNPLHIEGSVWNSGVQYTSMWPYGYSPWSWLL